MFPIILAIHIIAGSIALLSGTLAMIFPKGLRKHRLSGQSFSVSMLVTSSSAILLGLLNPSGFLMAVGLFTLYLVISGWVWSHSQPNRHKKFLLRGMGLMGIAFTLLMFYRAWQLGGGAASILLVFGGILLILSIGDFTIPKREHGYVFRHAGRMGGAYIAAVTAFLVVNLTFVPNIIVWLGPTIVGSIVLSILINKTTSRMQKA